MNLVLVGLRGAGKTAVGRRVAARRRVAFVDLDERIASLGGRTVSELLRQAGEAALRAAESEALASLDPPDATVIATGGGAVELAENRAHITRLGTVVWLQVSPEESVARTVGSDRPPLTSLPPLAEARALAARRDDGYRAVAQHVIETSGRSLEEVCDELEQLW